jgi:hypothetical protein
MFTILTSFKSTSYDALKSYYLEIDNYSCSSAAGAGTAATISGAADGAVERIYPGTPLVSIKAKEVFSRMVVVLWLKVNNLVYLSSEV